MDESNGSRSEVEALRDRLSKLSEASLRISESLDFDTVLPSVLDTARSLTAARYGVIVLLDDMGQVQDFLSSGMTDEEAKRLWELPEGVKLFEYLGSISDSLRVPDLLAHFRSLGLPEFELPMTVSPAITFLAAPIFHRGQRRGYIYVGEKEEGGEFTREDEETLVMFASQAGMAIGNARRHTDELRVRAELETLINNSPVGVVVLDAKTGHVISFNQEATRMTENLRLPHQSPEELIEMVTARRADGRETSIRELPLGGGETVQFEEITLQVPDGRSVTALLNATPVRSEDGDIESVVVTLQDMAAVESLERLRTDFLAMVSHELRGPLIAIKGSVDTLLGEASALDPAEKTQFHRIIRDQSQKMRDMINDLLDVARIETGTLPVSPERTDVVQLVDEARTGS